MHDVSKIDLQELWSADRRIVDYYVFTYRINFIIPNRSEFKPHAKFDITKEISVSAINMNIIIIV
jgi:hypothetical protein